MSKTTKRAQRLAHGERPEVPENRRCTASKAWSNGQQQCSNAAIKGGKVCPAHGGRAPQVREAANNRLMALVDPAISGLSHALKITSEVCSKCGMVSDANGLVKASTAVLDRTGFGAKQTISLERPEDTSWTQYLTDAEWDAMEQIIQAAKERMETEPIDVEATSSPIEDNTELPASTE